MVTELAVRGPRTTLTGWSAGALIKFLATALSAAALYALASTHYFTDYAQTGRAK